MGGKVDRSIPGPGSYTISNSPQGPKFSIGGAKIDPLFWGRGNSPGPGSYSLNDEVENRLLGGRFSSSKRPEAKPNDNPGPGFYDCKAALCFQGNKNVSYSKMYIFENGPAFSVKSKIINAICNVASFIDIKSQTFILYCKIVLSVLCKIFTNQVFAKIFAKIG